MRVGKLLGRHKERNQYLNCCLLSGIKHHLLLATNGKYNHQVHLNVTITDFYFSYKKKKNY